MLRNGKYPYHLQQRILSDSGHLSNEECAKYLSKYIGENTKTIFLAHLSDENNSPEVAMKTVVNILKENNKLIDDIRIAYQKEKTELVEV